MSGSQCVQRARVDSNRVISTLSSRLSSPFSRPAERRISPGVVRSIGKINYRCRNFIDSGEFSINTISKIFLAVTGWSVFFCSSV